MSMYHFEAQQPLELARFWSELLQIPVDAGASEELAMIDAAHEHGSITWIFQKATASSSPARRLALDLTDDENWRAEIERAQTLGARLQGEHEAAGVHWAELTDPDDNLFRIFAPRPE